uniref:Uncharacterized protein n=1 Tax=Leersia perrieri TaxID=77586 RepID=A0A0D9Y0E0_9ORYZ
MTVKQQLTRKATIAFLKSAECTSGIYNLCRSDYKVCKRNNSVSKLGTHTTWNDHPKTWYHLKRTFLEECAVMEAFGEVKQKAEDAGLLHCTK